MRARIALGCLLLFLIATRLCHAGVLWIEECYPAAAAIQMLYGKALYRDIWFDKPPLSSMFYLLWGAHAGVPLRIAGALFMFAACWMAFWFARAMWTEREGAAAAWLLGWFLTFGIPAAVIALAPDSLMVLPHLAAVYLAWRGRPFWSGVVAGVALLVNPKAVFVLGACLVWQWRSAPVLLIGFVLPNLLACGWMWAAGALGEYWRQVWEWGFVYSRDTFLARPVREGTVRTLAWVGFQGALVVGTAVALWRSQEQRLRWIFWIAIAFVGVVAGWRFFPRYYFLLLPPLVLLAGRTLTMRHWVRFVILALMLVPLVRFGPRYVQLATGSDPNWSDLGLARDSAQVSRLISDSAKPGDTLLVWGYRPDVFVRTRMLAASRFLDSQPLTGVIADRHLIESRPSLPQLAAENRAELIRTRPSFIVDGLGPLNPALSIRSFPDLRAWMNRQRYIERVTAASTVYTLEGGQH